MHIVNELLAGTTEYTFDPEGQVTGKILRSPTSKEIRASRTILQLTEKLIRYGSLLERHGINTSDIDNEVQPLFHNDLFTGVIIEME